MRAEKYDEKVSKKSMPMPWDELPEEARTEAMKAVKTRAAAMTMSLELKADGTFSVTGQFGPEAMTAAGTYKVDGEKITVTTTEEDGEAKEEPETFVGTLKDGRVVMRPKENMPFDMVLVKQ